MMDLVIDFAVGCYHVWYRQQRKWKLWCKLLVISLLLYGMRNLARVINLGENFSTGFDLFHWIVLIGALSVLIVITHLEILWRQAKTLESHNPPIKMTQAVEDYFSTMFPLYRWFVAIICVIESLWITVLANAATLSRVSYPYSGDWTIASTIGLISTPIAALIIWLVAELTAPFNEEPDGIFYYHPRPTTRRVRKYSKEWVKRRLAKLPPSVFDGEPLAPISATTNRFSDPESRAYHDPELEKSFTEIMNDNDFGPEM
jgi:hypothetical protein